jgi:hypothetical protein
LDVDLPEGILRPSRLGGRRLKAQTQSAHAEWIEKGKPDPITAKICDEILRTVYPTEFAKVRVGSKAHKRWRDRVRTAILRHEERSATKPIS